MAPIAIEMPIPEMRETDRFIAVIPRHLSRENSTDNLPRDIRQTKIAAGVAVREPQVIDPE